MNELINWASQFSKYEKKTSITKEILNKITDEAVDIINDKESCRFGNNQLSKAIYTICMFKKNYKKAPPVKVKITINKKKIRFPAIGDIITKIEIDPKDLPFKLCISDNFIYEITEPIFEFTDPLVSCALCFSWINNYKEINITFHGYIIPNDLRKLFGYHEDKGTQFQIKKNIDPYVYYRGSLLFGNGRFFLW